MAYIVFIKGENSHLFRFLFHLRKMMGLPLIYIFSIINK